MRSLTFFLLDMVFPALSKSLVWDQVIELQGRYEVVVLYQHRYMWYHYIGIESLYFASTV